MLASTNITITVAFLAGLASFLSPCVLPLVPGYISLISGVSIDRLKQQTEERSSTRRWVIVNSLAFKRRAVSDLCLARPQLRDLSDLQFSPARGYESSAVW